MSAAREYKAIIGGLTDAADALRERDRKRAAELVRELADRDDAMTRIGERVALTRLGVELHWEAAIEALWSESWMTLRPMPVPERSGAAPAGPADFDALDAAVTARFADLMDAVRRRRLGLRR
jgi:hypothetical protein